MLLLTALSSDIAIYLMISITNMLFIQHQYIPIHIMLFPYVEFNT